MNNMDMSKLTPCPTKPYCLGDFLGMHYNWARSSDNGYEVSSAGDHRFSAFNAVLLSDQDGLWTIENYYQIVVKGYQAEAKASGLPFNEWWRVGKGKKPKIKQTERELYVKYRKLWEVWSINNPILFKELARRSWDKTLTDKFAHGEVNQAHALSDLLNEKFDSYSCVFDETV